MKAYTYIIDCKVLGVDFTYPPPFATLFVEI